MNLRHWSFFIKQSPANKTLIAKFLGRSEVFHLLNNAKKACKSGNGFVTL